MKLAELFVEFAVRRDKEVKAAIDAVGKQLTAMGEDATRAGAVFTQAMKLQEDAARKVAEAYKQIRAAGETAFATVNAALGVATAAVTGFAKQGLAASAMGQVLAQQMDMLTRTVAGLFGPEIQAVIGYVREFTGWLQSLTDEQKASIVHWVEAAAGALAVAGAFKVLVPVIGSVVAGVRALTVAITSGLSATGIGALLPLVGLLVEGLTAMFVGTESGREVLGALWEAFKPIAAVVQEVASAVGSVLSEAFSALADVVKALMPLIQPLIDAFARFARFVVNVLLAPLRAVAWLLGKIARGIAAVTGVNLDTKKAKPKEGGRGVAAPRAGGFEGIDAAYQRFASAAVMAGAGKSPQEITNDKLDEVKDAVNETTKAVGNIKPAVGR